MALGDIEYRIVVTNDKEVRLMWVEDSAWCGWPISRLRGIHLSDLMSPEELKEELQWA